MGTLKSRDWPQDQVSLYPYNTYNDGRIDAVVSVLGDPVKLFQGSRHWILLNLVGARSNRMAIGAQAGEIARRVTVDVFAMVLAGALVGLALGLASVRYIETLLYQVKVTDLGVLALPSLSILAAALLAALPAVIRAVRIDPVMMLRAE